MPPRNSTPHSKRTKGGGAHAFAPYARPNKESTDESKEFTPLELLMDIEGIIASKKEARKKAKKVRFHQRECAVSEPSEGTVVFPAPSKAPSTPTRASFSDEPAVPLKARAQASFATRVVQQSQCNAAQAGNGPLSFSDLVSRINDLETMAHQNRDMIETLRERCHHLESENAFVKHELATLRRGSSNDGSPRKTSTSKFRREKTPMIHAGMRDAAPETIDEDRPMADVFGEKTAMNSGHNNYSPMEPADSSSSVLVFPSSSPASDSSEIATPKDSPYGVNRVIDENYDEGIEEHLLQMRRKQIAEDVNRTLGIQNSMDSDEMLERIADSMPRIWNIKEDEKPKGYFSEGLKLAFPPLLMPPMLPPSF